MDNSSPVNAAVPPGRLDWGGEPCFTEAKKSSLMPHCRTTVEVTKKIAEYVVNTGLEDFPPEAIFAAKAAIIDCLGCALAGSKEPLADILVSYLTDLGGKPAATVIGRGFKTSAPENLLGWPYGSVAAPYVGLAYLRRHARLD